MAPEPELAPCSRCGERAGELSESRTRRFPYLVFCGSCGWSAEPASIKAVALKLWNEAKPVKKKGGRQ